MLLTDFCFGVYWFSLCDVFWKPRCWSEFAYMHMYEGGCPHYCVCYLAAESRNMWLNNSSARLLCLREVKFHASWLNSISLYRHCHWVFMFVARISLFFFNTCSSKQSKKTNKWQIPCWNSSSLIRCTFQQEECFLVGMFFWNQTFNTEMGIESFSENLYDFSA